MGQILKLFLVLLVGYQSTYQPQFSRLLFFWGGGYGFLHNHCAIRPLRRAEEAREVLRLVAAINAATKAHNPSGKAGETVLSITVKDLYDAVNRSVPRLPVGLNLNCSYTTAAGIRDRTCLNAEEQAKKVMKRICL